MKANEVKLLGLLQGPRQFTIPIYQRPYSWARWECQKLFDDIISVGKDAIRSSYFMGSVVYYQESAHAIGTIPASLVIDGQQRLTTVLLLLTAVARFLQEKGEPLPDTSSQEIRGLYLTNLYKQGELAQRLLLTKRDKETLIAVVNGNPLPQSNSERVRENFELFQQQITTANVAALWAGISKLMVVGVSLEAGIDNPQLIFESLNSTGKLLDQSDLIRNYVLMGQAKAVQDDLYERYWYPMEESFGDDYAWMFSEYMRDFLTVKLAKLINIHTVYQTFKDEYAAGRISEGNVEALAKELYQNAGYYVRLRQPEKEEHQELREALKQLRAFGVTVAYPYLIDAYAACELGKLTKPQLAEVVRMIERYVVRRSICEIPTNTLNSTFATFARDLNQDDYFNSVKEQFLELGYNRRFPLDEEFRNRFVERNAYHARRTRDYLLSHLANYQQKEYVSIDNYTVEHIMPQNENVSEAWRAELGPQWEEVHSRYLHTIGNLTLTGYNSELSDRPFAEKKTMEGGFLTSPIKLNQSVASEPVWNKEAILKRANLLADWAIAIWPVPVVATAVVVSDEEVDEQQEEAALVEAGLLEEDQNTEE